MKTKIDNAIQYVRQNRSRGDLNEIKNDAANIFADSFEEYNEIWRHLDDL